MTSLRKELYIEGINKEDLYLFLSDPKNIEKVYPSSLKAKVLKKDGSYEVKLRLLGQNFKWVIEKKIESPNIIIDEYKGILFKKWVHKHLIKDHEKGVLMVDEIEFKTSLGFIGDYFAKKYIERIFEYRNSMILKFFGKDIVAYYEDPLSFSLNKGTAVLSLLTIFAISLLFFIPENVLFYLIFGLLSWFLLWYCTHVLAHLLVGSILGIKFSNYYIGLSNLFKIDWIPQRLKLILIAPAIKIDREKTKVSKKRYAIMYIAGPIASMLTPFFPAFLIFQKDFIIGLFLLIISIANLFFDLYFSPKYGCISKALKVMK